MVLHHNHLWDFFCCFPSKFEDSGLTHGKTCTDVLAQNLAGGKPAAMIPEALEQSTTMLSALRMVGAVLS